MKREGRLVRIAGPAAVVEGLDAPGMNELVLVGDERLRGEVIRVANGLATVQIYEDTEGLSAGEPAFATGLPLVAELGPGLLGQIYDGVQRSLPELAKRGPFLGRGESVPALDRTRRWTLTPAISAGAVLGPGAVLGSVQETTAIAHRVLLPPDVRGVVREIRAGDFAVDEPFGSLEDGTSLTLMQRWPVRRRRPYRRRLRPEVPFLTGQRVLDSFFPVASGGTAIIPGGFGTGKTVLEQTLAKFAAADVIVFVGCGERGNEMTEVLDEFPRLLDPRSGGPLMERTVMVVNTSNMPVAAREASIYTGVTIAEYFRDMGFSVALMVDSTSRWAEALREISSRLQEMPGEEGYPTYLATRLGAFYERAGRVVPLSGTGEGTVTIVGAVSPPGGDFSEPVTQASLRVTGALWALDADLAHRRHYPAVDWGLSFSLDAPALEGWFAREAGEGWNRARTEAMGLLQREAELQEIVQLVGVESIQDDQRVLLESARLLREGFLRQNAYHEIDATCAPTRSLVILELLLDFHRAASDAVSRSVPLSAVLASGIPERLLRLPETPPAGIASAAAAIRAAIAALSAGTHDAAGRLS